MPCYYTLAHFYTAPLPSAQVSVPPKHLVSLLASVLFSVSNSALRGVGQTAIASVVSGCSAAVLLQLVLKCAMLEFLKGVFIVLLASRKSRIILCLNKNTVCFSL